MRWRRNTTLAGWGHVTDRLCPVRAVQTIKSSIWRKSSETLVRYHVHRNHTDRQTRLGYLVKYPSHNKSIKHAKSWHRLIVTAKSLGFLGKEFLQNWLEGWSKGQGQFDLALILQCRGVHAALNFWRSLKIFVMFRLLCVVSLKFGDSQTSSVFMLNSWYESELLFFKLVLDEDFTRVTVEWLTNNRHYSVGVRYIQCCWTSSEHSNLADKNKKGSL